MSDIFDSIETIRVQPVEPERPVTIYLTHDEVEKARHYGTLRQEHSVQQGRTDRHGLDPAKGLEVNILGVCGEIALARFLKIDPFTPTVDAPKHEPDVGPYQVRAVSSALHSLLIREDDNPESIFWLVAKTYVTDLFIIKGWLMAKNGMRKEWLTDRGNGREPAYFVPQARLKRPDQIPALSSHT